MTDFSSDVKNTVLKKLLNQTDIGCSQILENCHTKFLEGDRSAIMTALIACSFFSEVIPDWVADELLTLDESLSCNQVKDLNEFFNLNILSPSKRSIQRNIEKNEIKTLNILINHRLAGGGLNDDIDLRPIAKKLGITQRALQKIVKKHNIKNYKKNQGSKKHQIIGEAKFSLLSIAKSFRAKHD